MPALSISQNANDVSSAFSAVRLMVGRADLEGAKTWETVLKIPGQRLMNCQSADEAMALVRNGLADLEAKGVLEGEWILSIPPSDKNGFPIDLLRNAEPTRVRCLFGILEQEFETIEHALVWVRLALSNSYQLRITSVGDQPRRWRLEPVDASSGSAALEMGHGLPFFWRGRTQSEIRRNFFPLDREATAVERVGS